MNTGGNIEGVVVSRGGVRLFLASKRGYVLHRRCYIIEYDEFEFEMRDLKTRDRVAYTLTQFPMMMIELKRANVY